MLFCKFISSFTNIVQRIVFLFVANQSFVDSGGGDTRVSYFQIIFDAGSDFLEGGGCALAIARTYIDMFVTARGWEGMLTALGKRDIVEASIELGGFYRVQRVPISLVFALQFGIL